MATPPAFLAHLGDTTAPLVLPSVGAMRDQQLMDAQREVAEVQRRLSAIAASLAGEIAHRSRRELGHCDQPPSWAEAHHIDHWDEHGGRTDIDDAIAC